MFLHTLCSWKPGFDGISSKISSVLWIIHNPAKWLETIDFAPIPHAQTRKETYAKEMYTAKHKANGRDRARHIIRTLLQAKYGIVFFHTNKLIFDHDPVNGYALAAMFLEREFGFVECLSFLFGEICMYRTIPQTHAVLFHGPLCHASLSQEGIKLEYNVCRAITIAILSNVACLVRGKPPLTSQA